LNQLAVEEQTQRAADVSDKEVTPTR
jgi:hypothetical protein